VDKLVTVVAAAEDPDRLSAPDPLEEDLEHAKPAVAQDRSRPHDGDVEPLALDEAPRDALGLELGVAVRLSGPGLDRVADGVARRDAEDGARGDEDDLADTPARAGAEQVLGAAHVHALEQVPILRERHLGDVVVDDVDPLARALDRIRVAHIAAEIAHLARAVGHVDEVEEGDLPAAPSSSATSRHPKYPLPPVTCACRPVATQMSIPCARHHAMLRRIPSSSSISGS